MERFELIQFISRIAGSLNAEDKCQQKLLAMNVVLNHWALTNSNLYYFSSGLIGL